MKFSITMKDPDAVFEAVRHAVDRSLSSIEGLSEQERAKLYVMRESAIVELLNKWFSFHEILTVVIDTEAKTCTVTEK